MIDKPVIWEPCEDSGYQDGLSNYDEPELINCDSYLVGGFIPYEKYS